MPSIRGPYDSRVTTARDILHGEERVRMVIFPKVPIQYYPIVNSLSCGTPGGTTSYETAWDPSTYSTTTATTTTNVTVYPHPLNTYQYEVTIPDIHYSTMTAGGTATSIEAYAEQMRWLADKWAGDLNGVIHRGEVPNSQGILDNLRLDIVRLDRHSYESEHQNYEYQMPPQMVVTPEQVAAANLRRAQERAAEDLEAKVKAERRVIAVNKGEKLLEDVLGSSEYSKLRKDGFIDIPSMKSADMMYRVRKGKRIGVVKLENGIWVEKHLSLCIHPENHWKYVDGDQVAAHVLLCKFDEATLEKVANKHNYRAA